MRGDVGPCELSSFPANESGAWMLRTIRHSSPLASFRAAAKNPAGSQLAREILRFAQDDDGMLRMTMSDSAFFRVFARFALSRLVRFSTLRRLGPQRTRMVLDIHLLDRHSGDIHCPVPPCRQRVGFRARMPSKPASGAWMLRTIRHSTPLPSFRSSTVIPTPSRHSERQRRI